MIYKAIIAIRNKKRTCSKKFNFLFNMGIILIVGLIISFTVPLNVLAKPVVDEFAKLDEGGEKILEIVQRLGYWIILLKCITELIKQGLQGELHSIGKTIMTYLLLYGALFFVPWLLGIISGLF